MGEESFASGVGSVAVLLSVTNDIYVIAPVYWVTKNMTNNRPPGYIKLLPRFKRNIFIHLNIVI